MTSSLPSSRNNSVSRPEGVDMYQAIIWRIESRLTEIINTLHSMYPRHMYDTELINSLQYELKQHMIAHAVLRRIQLKDNKPWKPQM